MMPTQEIKDGLMRINHWFAYTILGMSLLCTSDLKAQNPFSGGDSSDKAEISLHDPEVEGASYENNPFSAPPPGANGPYGPPPQEGFSGPAGMPPGGAYAPGTPAMAPQGNYPQNFGPWPRISPYDYKYDQTAINKDGLWERFQTNPYRKWFAIAEFLAWSMEEPKDTTIGA